MKSKIYMKGMNIMNIMMIGYIIGDNKITVSYDNKKFLVEEEYRDRDIGVKMGFSYIVKIKRRS